MNGAMNIIVPAFFPWGSALTDWKPIYASLPTVKAAVLDISLNKLDPTVSFNQFLMQLGPWGSVAPQLVQDAHAQAPGLLVLGYVPTDSATAVLPKAPVFENPPRQPYRTLADIQSYVDHWYRLCPTLDGIFFDEGPAPWRFTGAQSGMTFKVGYTVDPLIEKFYKDIYDHVKTKTSGRGTHVMLNASEFMDQWVMGVADTVGLFEGDYIKYESKYKLQPWISNYPPVRIYHLIHSCQGFNFMSDQDQMIRMVAVAQERGAGLVYVFDGTSAAYNKLPSYWTDEVAAASDLCNAIRSARGRALDETLRIMRKGMPSVFDPLLNPLELQLAWGCSEVYLEMGRHARILGS